MPRPVYNGQATNAPTPAQHNYCILTLSFGQTIPNLRSSENRCFEDRQWLTTVDNKAVLSDRGQWQICRRPR
uniref:Lectin n=1 Tax=Heterorhabditis bacteriophora TaxID=37862 RepID=A0A1I7XFQ6_HETBA